ncbi:hypothetical protein Mapa_009343 [Marchantia paleacea]|nr:hypothetical protein Mapa_009343 [Marchantia paleacea]
MDNITVVVAHLISGDRQMLVIHLTAIPVNSAILDVKDVEGLRRCFSRSEVTGN